VIDNTAGVNIGQAFPGAFLGFIFVHRAPFAVYA
jgi:hypothetical protein